MVWITLEFSFIYVSGPSSSVRSGGVISSTGRMVPQPFAAGGNRSYLKFWAVAKRPAVPGVLNLDSSPRAFHRAGGRSRS
jgi:hypothetical protein